jgi:hypothetical protein
MMAKKTVRRRKSNRILLPIQPLEYDVLKTLRFRENKIVRYLIDLCRDAGICDMNKLALMDFPIADREQFAQLIGYSLSGFGELSYVTDKTFKRAERQKVFLVKPK